MKKIGIFTLVSFIVFFGLGSNLFAVGGQQSSAPGHVTISFWHSMTDNAGLAFDTYVREFNEGPGAAANITVEAVFQGQYADATARLRPLLMTGQVNALPDVMQIDATGIVDYLNTEFAYTVDDALQRDRNFNLNQYMEAPLRAWNYGGRQLGIPVSASTTIMYYNKSILDAAGISAPPTTFDEIIEVSRHLPPVNVNNQTLTAFANQPNTPLLANWIGQIPGRGLGASYVVNERNGRDGDATRLVADTEGTLLTFLRAWQAMYNAGALLNVSASLSNLFLTQQTVFFTASTASLTSLLDQIDGRFELGAAYFPRINSASNFGATVSGSALFMFNKRDQARADAAWEFVKFMTSPEIQARFSVATGYTPVNLASAQNRAYLDHIARFPQAEVGTNQLAITSPDMMGVIVGPSRNFYFEIENQGASMLNDGRTPEETVTSMARALNLLLDDFAEANR